MTARVGSAEVDGFRPEIRVAEEAREGWIALPDLADPRARAERHRTIARVAGSGAPPRLPFAWEVEGLAWLIGVLVGGGLLRCGAHPDPDPGSVRVRIDGDGLPAGLELGDGTPCISHGVPGARRTIERLLAACLPDPSERRSRVLWWHAGDRVADAVLWCGQAFALVSEARRMAGAMLAPGMPYSVPLGLAPGGEARTRHTCCLARRTEGGVECESCPHRRRRASS